MKNKKTTIWIDKSTKEKLHRLKLCKTETADSLLRRLFLQFKNGK